MLFRFLVFAAVLGLFAVLLPRILTAWHARARLFTLADAPSRRVAVVFGAGLTRDHRPTPVLRDRVETAADLYFAGKVEKILMSGDNRFVEYNEPQAMKDYALSLGVPDEAVVLDFAGRSTYETCYRAREIFQLTEPILVTQSFHLPRALYTCNALGLDAVGVSADRREYRTGSEFYWNLRELLATANAFVDVYITQPLPVLGEVEPIFSSEVD